MLSLALTTTLQYKLNPNLSSHAILSLTPTQLGGCAVVGAGGEPLYSWVDGGLCDLVPDFELLLDAL